ncbi:MAG: glycosyltransferase family 9 protein [Gemmatimonadota bacterium]|nr:glycosyltransferase family 9 protein [Gemmatimonadota bacterium]
MSARTSPLRRFRRRINRRFYRALVCFYRAAFPARVPRGRIAPGSLRRILLVRHDRVGDMIVTTPVLAFLRDVAPQAELDVLASPANAPLVAADERVARVFTNDHTWRGWLAVLPQLRARRYDAILSVIYGKGLREGLTAALIARRHTHRVSVIRPKRYAGLFTLLVRVPRAERHMAQKLLFVVQQALDTGPVPKRAATDRYPLAVAIGAEADERAARFVAEHGIDRFVAVNLASAEASKEWSPSVCAEVLRLLLPRYPALAFVLTPPPGKLEPAERVARALGSPRVLLYPPPSILVLSAILQRSVVVLTPDTANVHVASAVRRPVLALYTPLTNPPGLWSPFQVPHRIVEAAAGQPVSTIGAETIARAFDDLMREIGAVEGAPDALARAP